MFLKTCSAQYWKLLFKIMFIFLASTPTSSFLGSDFSLKKTNRALDSWVEENEIMDKNGRFWINRKRGDNVVPVNKKLTDSFAKLYKTLTRIACLRDINPTQTCKYATSLIKCEKNLNWTMRNCWASVPRVNEWNTITNRIILSTKSETINNQENWGKILTVRG